jgi:hypothetical protein
MIGPTISFRITSHRRLGAAAPNPPHTRPKAKLPGLKLLVDREPICRACEWFGPEDRCCHPHAGCAKGWWRIQPWARMLMCPAAMWR